MKYKDITNNVKNDIAAGVVLIILILMISTAVVHIYYKDDVANAATKIEDNKWEVIIEEYKHNLYRYVDKKHGIIIYRGTEHQMTSQKIEDIPLGKYLNTLGDKPSPTLNEIMGMIPEEKRMVIIKTETKEE